MAQESDVLTIGQEMNFDYSKPKKYEIGAVRIEGADNYDHNAVRLIAGLRPGQMITIPGDDISKAISNLWKEQLFSNVEIFALIFVNCALLVTISDFKEAVCLLRALSFGLSFPKKSLNSPSISFLSFVSSCNGSS